MNSLHATIEEFTADGYTHVQCFCPRCRQIRLRPISDLPRISMGLTIAQLSARLRCAQCRGPLHSVKPWRLEDVLESRWGGEDRTTYAKPRPTPLPHVTRASSVKPRVLHATTARKVGSPIPPLSKPTKASSTKPPPLPRKSPEARSLSAPVLPSAARHYLVLDTVGNCSVIDAKPSAGLKIIGDKGGYASPASANRAMNNEAKCKGTVVTGAVDQDAAGKYKAAEAKAKKLGGVHKLTQEDIEGLSAEQIKLLRGY
jgi:hypothetical protein